MTRTMRSSRPGTSPISTNEEYNQTMALIGVRSRRVDVVVRARRRRAGRRPVTCRIRMTRTCCRTGSCRWPTSRTAACSWVNRAHRIVRSIGHAGDCTHDPPSDAPARRTATRRCPTAACSSRRSAAGSTASARPASCVYTVRTPTTYPSDAQLLPNGDILVAGFNMPGPSGRDHPERQDRLDVRQPTW